MKGEHLDRRDLTLHVSYKLHCEEVRRRSLQPTDCPASKQHNTARPWAGPRGIPRDGYDAHVRLVHGYASHRNSRPK
jgi:hypothetical protein